MWFCLLLRIWSKTVGKEACAGFEPETVTSLKHKMLHLYSLPATSYFQFICISVQIGVYTLTQRPLCTVLIFKKLVRIVKH